MAVKWKWNNNTGGGNVPAGLEQRIQAVETNTVKITGDQSIAGVKTFTGGVVSRTSTELGTEIKAGYGGVSVKFIPEDNSTKTLQFYNNNATDTRRFNLLVPEPTAAQNPATKNYVDNKFKYVKKGQASNITCNANSYQSHEFTINGLTTGLNEFYIVLTTSNVDIGFEVKIQCNNLNYPNMSDIKYLSTSNWQTSNIDQLGTIMVGFIQYGNNKFRMRMKNLHSSNITFNGYRVYHRIPGSLADN